MSHLILLARTSARSSVVPSLTGASGRSLDHSRCSFLSSFPSSLSLPHRLLSCLPRSSNHIPSDGPHATVTVCISHTFDEKASQRRYAHLPPERSNKGKSRGIEQGKEKAAWRIIQRHHGAPCVVHINSTGRIDIEPCQQEHFFGGKQHDSHPQAAAWTSPGQLLWGMSSLHKECARQIIVTFFPSGYPSSVAPGYAHFAGWQALHHAASAANGVIASTFLLYGVGLSAGEAIPTAGALNWVLKDGIGQAGTLLFGRFMAQNFDVNSRLWYLAASAKLNIAMGLEIATSIMPHAFLPLGAMANAVKGLAWMAGGSSRSALNVAFAKESNIADITAKATSQTICTSLIGTSIGLGTAAAIGQSTALALGCYATFGFFHLWTSWQSVRNVPLATLNPTRLWLLSQHALDFVKMDIVLEKRCSHQSCKSRSIGESLHIGNLPSPSELARKDPIFTFMSKKARLVFGADITKATRRYVTSPGKAQALAAIISVFREHRYLLIPDDVLYPEVFSIVLHEQASTRDIMHAVLQAAIWQECVLCLLNLQDRSVSDRLGPRCDPLEERASLANAEERYDIESAREAKEYLEYARMAGISLDIAQCSLDAFLRKLKEAGWETDRVVVEAKRRRVMWTTSRPSNN